MNPSAKLKILFLCTGNSARSIFAEYLLRKIAGDRFETYSAGSDPSGRVNPLTLQILKNDYDIDARDARSKSWSEFKETRFDIVITVCDRAKESCPIFPGEPNVAHWSIPDPVAATGTDEQKRRAFKEAAQQIFRRLQLLRSFPREKLDHFLMHSAQKGENAQPKK
ncbi:MAG TPA: arsenate reductase ArsC [Candidatus Eisenbacteria bacterium]|nr:arsenate reductase ArsC [Candidatus Eisenbacteria bacterium]